MLRRRETQNRKEENKIEYRKGRWVGGWMDGWVDGWTDR
jgi:hypothetical protein